MRPAVSAWWSPPGGPCGCSQASGHLALSLPDERDRVQKKTFTKWVNKHLIKVGGVCTRVCTCVCVRTHRVMGWRRLWVEVKEGASDPPSRNKSCPHCWPGGLPFISETCYSLSSPCLPHAAPDSCLPSPPPPLSPPASPALLVALEGRGRCLHGGGACSGVRA